MNFARTAQISRYTRKTATAAAILATTGILAQAQTATPAAPTTPIPSPPASAPKVTIVQVHRVTDADPDPAKKAKEMKAAGPLDYSNEPAVIEHNATLFRYAADGTGQRTQQSQILMQNDAVVRQFGVISFGYAASFEHVEFHYVRVRKPNGTVVVTDTSAAQDMPTEVTREAPLYSDQRQMQVPVQGLAVGDRLEYEVVVHVQKAEAPGQFWSALNFEHTSVARDQVIELRYPKTVKLTVLSPEYAPAKHEEAGEIVYRWHLDQAKPTVAPPGGMAPVADDTPPSLVPDVAWTTFSDWAAVGNWYRDLAGNRGDVSPEVKAKAASLIAGASTDEEKINRLYRYVSMQIHYIGIDFGIGRYQPHSAAEVLSNGYGDCKDKHTLLAALLAAQGFHADPVLIGMNIEIDKDLPAPNSFNHVITAVELPGGKRLWLDSTAEIAPEGMLTMPLRDKDALLIASAPGVPRLVKTPADLPFVAADSYNIKATLSAEGKLTAHFDATLHGDLELYMRAALFMGGRGQWAQVGQAISQGMGFGGTVTDFVPQGVDDPAAPLHLTYAYERDPFGDWPNRRIIAMIPNALFSTATYDKQPPKAIELGAVRVESAHSEIALPPGFRVDKLPEPVHARSSFAAFDLSYGMQGSTLVTDERLQITATSVPAAKWEEYNAFSRDIQNNDGLFLQLNEHAASNSTSGSTHADKGETTVHAAPNAGTGQTYDAATQALMAEAQDALQQGDVSTAQARFDQARTAHQDEPGMWAFASELAARKGNDIEGQTDMQKEIDLHPEEREKLLPALLFFELKQKHNADAANTLEAMRQLDPNKPEWTRQEAALMLEDKRYEDAIALLEDAALHNPGDKWTLLALGNAQIAGGRTREATRTLETSLEGATDPMLLNDGAYALAEHNLDLPLAAKDARAALDLLEAKTRAVVPDKVEQADLGTQTLLSAAWDTYGFIQMTQGNTTQAEPYLRAAWVSSQHPEVGYHLGTLLEKEGQPQQALDAYLLAQSAGPRFSQSDALQARVSALEKQGLQPVRSDNTGSTQLADQRLVNLPLLVKQHSTADYLIFATTSGIDAVRWLKGDGLLAQQTAAVEKTLIAALNKNRATLLQPPDSTAKLIRRGVLSCSPEIHSCQFVVFLTQDARMPAPAIQITQVAPAASTQSGTH